MDESNGHFAMQIVAVALENFMLSDVQYHVKIALVPAAKAGFAIAG